LNAADDLESFVQAEKEKSKRVWGEATDFMDIELVASNGSVADCYDGRKSEKHGSG
jgi:hypothetical protein